MLGSKSLFSPFSEDKKEKGGRILSQPNTWYFFFYCKKKTTAEAEMQTEKVFLPFSGSSHDQHNLLERRSKESH